MRWTRAEHPEPLKRDGAILAGTRDASFYNHPGRSGRYHIAVNDERPACNTTTALLVEATFQPVAKVESWLRCQRPACRRWWP